VGFYCQQFAVIYIYVSYTRGYSIAFASLEMEKKNCRARFEKNVIYELFSGRFKLVSAACSFQLEYVRARAIITE